MNKFSFFMIFFMVSIISCGQPTLQNSKISFLHTRGQYIVNEKNDTLLLRGVGLGNWLLPEGYMWHFGDEADRPRKIEALISDLTDPEYSDYFWQRFRKNYIREGDIKKIKELGFNSVRPALNARVFMTEGDTAVFIEENFELLDNLVSWCEKYGIYIILDMHGAPGGQTGQNIDDSPRNLPELFMDPKYEKRLTRLWMKLVERYKDHPVIAGYDLLNEPLPHRTGAADKYKHMLEPMYKRLTEAIRSVDQNHLIFLEGADWSNDWSVFSEPFDDNTVYQFHYYCWNRPDNLNSIEYFLKKRDTLNVPVWVGETGEKNKTIYWGTTQLFETNNIGWSFWPWKKLDRTNGLCSINRPDGWNKLVDFTKGGSKPPVEEAKKILNTYLENIKFENCTFYDDVYRSLSRKIPGRIAAVNYGHDGYQNSFFVHDTVSKANYYRTEEPVIVELIDYEPGQWSSRQCIVLNAKEWVKYQFNCDSLGSYPGKMMIKTENDEAMLSIFINDEMVKTIQPGDTWEPLSMGSIYFRQGSNSLKIVVDSGSAKIEYFEFLIEHQN